MNTKEEIKYVVVDTNIPMLDNFWYEGFKEYTIVIPFTVISEIDKHKSGMGMVGINSRNMARLIGRISEKSKDSPNGVVSMEEGTFMIHLPHFKDQDERTVDLLDLSVNDDKIIYSAIELKVNNPKAEVVLASNDCNVRSKVLYLYKHFNIDAVTYSEDKGFKVQEYYKQFIYSVEDQVIADLYSKTLRIEDVDNTLIANNPVTLVDKNGQEILARVDYDGKYIKQLRKKSTYEISNFKPANANQSHLVSMALDENIKILSVIGRTGSGKTLTVVSSALHLLDTGKVSKIKLIKPYAPMGNSVGMLKGSWEDKIAPIRKTFIAIFNLLGKDLDVMEKQGIVEFSTPEFERGENYFSTALIISEAQNMNKEIKSLITRCNDSEGSSCYIFVEGDTRQVDDRFLSEDSNGLSNLINKLSGQPFYGHIYLDKSERAEFLNIVDDLL